MKRRIVVFITAVLLFMVALGIGWYGMKDRKIRFIEKLANGINMGNTLDATGLWQYKPDADELSYETCWGNPPISQEQFAAVREAGFHSVRIPVTWEDHMADDGTISDVWLNRVENVVREALDEGLYVILDTHHETWLDLDIAQQEDICEKYRIVWTQIAERFCDVDDHLLFEGMNEPRLRGSEHEWDAGTAQLREMVNCLNAEFVDTVRATGGENATRYLMICAYASGSVEEALEALSIPDGNIVVSVHMYLPYSFCQDEKGTDRWSQTSQEDTAEITKALENIDRLFIQKGIPVIIAECGCRDKGNDTERAAWLSFFTGKAREYRIPCIWWDNGSTYQLLERRKGNMVHPQLVEILTQS